MPGGDGTGPGGIGPLTGRGMGFCSGSGVRGSAYGIGRLGLGCRRGWGRGFAAPDAAIAAGPYGAGRVEDEKRLLETRAGNLRAALRRVEERLGEMGSAKES